MYDWVTSLYSRNWHIINQLYFDKNSNKNKYTDMPKMYIYIYTYIHVYFLIISDLGRNGPGGEYEKNWDKVEML